MKIPEETQEKIRLLRDYATMRDKSIELWWGEKRALKYARLYNDTLDDIKMTVHELYPDIYSEGTWHWNFMGDGTVEVFKGNYDPKKYLR